MNRAYRNRPLTTEDIVFLVGDEALEADPGGFVTLRVPVIAFDGIAVDQVLLGDALRMLEEGLGRAPSVTLCRLPRSTRLS